VRKGAGFLGGAAILAGAGILCRVLGVVIRIPLANIVGNYGMGIYQMVFPLYALLLIVSSAGVPVAISKMVAKRGNTHESRRILLNSVVLLGFIGLVVSALFIIFSYQIAHFQGDRHVGVIYIAIAPAIFFVCIISALRGYFQGLQNMVPTGLSQVIEQIIKLVFALSLAAVLIKFSVIWAVFGAILAVTIAEIAALLFLIALYIFSKKKTAPAAGVRETRGKILSFSLMWDILKQSIPITLMSAIFPLILVLDSMFVIKMLGGGKEATQLFGIQSGTVHTMINLPAVLAIALATAVVPTVSALLKAKKVQELRQKMAVSVQITALIALFFTVFYLFFPQQIIDLLYHGAFREAPNQLGIATNLMRIESALIFLMGLSAVFTAMLQGADKAKLPLIALLIGGIVKIIFQFSMIGAIGIYAVSIGNVLCFSIAAILNTIFALKYIKIKRGLALKLSRFGFLALVFVFGVRLLVIIMPAGRMWLLLSGSISFGMYAILLALFGFLRFNKNMVGNT
jgi:stage V sporulation protein B